MKREHLATAGYSLMVGLLATLTMDLTALVMVKTGLFRLGPYRVVPELLSRWIGSFPAGAFVHSTILETAPVPHEKLIGLASHYLIGLTLTSVLLFPHVGIRHRSISFRTGLLFGLVTCIFPWFLMFPAMGFGIMGLNLPRSAPLMPLSLLNHAVFGLGIFLWSNVVLVSKWRRSSQCEESLGSATTL